MAVSLATLVGGSLATTLSSSCTGDVGFVTPCERSIFGLLRTTPEIRERSFFSPEGQGRTHRTLCARLALLGVYKSTTGVSVGNRSLSVKALLGSSSAALCIPRLSPLDDQQILQASPTSVVPMRNRK